MNIIRKESPKKFHWHAFLAVAFERDQAGSYSRACVYGKVKGKQGRGAYTVQEEFLTRHSFERFLMDLKDPDYTGEPCRLVFHNLSHAQWFLEDVIKKVSYRHHTGVYNLTLLNGLKGMDITNYATHLNLEGMDAPEQARVIFTAVEEIQESCRALGVTMYNTAPTTAFVLFKRTLPMDLYRTDESLNAFEAEAYYGGRVECYWQGLHTVQSYDVIGMYLWIMASNRFPRPQSSRRFSITKPAVWEDMDQAIVSCRVHVPYSYIPVLPVRVNNQLIFPTGTFDGVWTNLELHEAVSQGVDVIRVYEGVEYESEPLFRDFAKAIGPLRREHPWFKLLGNALYGKFGQKVYSNPQYVRLKDYDGDMNHIPDMGLSVVDGEDWLHEAGDLVGYSEHSFVCISAFITSMARLWLLPVLQCNSDRVVYTDTDCIKITNPPNNMIIGDSIGTWKMDHDFIPVQFFGAKDYVMPEEHVIAGLPKRATTVDGRRYSFTRPVGFREGIRTGMIPTTELEKEVLLHEEDTKRVYNEDGSSRPVKL